MSRRRDGVIDSHEMTGVLPSEERLAAGPVVVIECVENIPCNPCVDACPRGAITMEEDINQTPDVDVAKCNGCGLCISACPGLAIFVIDASRDDGTATISLPYEYVPLPTTGETVAALDREGNVVCNATVVRVLSPRAFDRTPVVSLTVPMEHAGTVRHLRRKVG